MKKRLAVVGAGELFLQVKHYAEIDGRYDVVGFFVDYPLEFQIGNIPHLGMNKNILEVYKQGLFDCLFIAIGYKHLDYKYWLYNSLKGSIPFATIFACPTYIDDSARIGEGVIVYPGVIIDKDVIVEDNVILNLGATICHNCYIKNSSFIGVNVAISGFCKIGNRCFLGTNSTLIDNITISDDVYLGASTLVNKDITLPGTYVGVPFHILEKSNS